MREVVIADYGVGNLRSVARAIEHVGGKPLLATRPEEVAAARLLIVPGVGAFGSCVTALKAHGLMEPVLEVIASGHPTLGICVGMQMLLEESEEFGRHPGLGVIPGTVQPVSRVGANGLPHKIPHIGWSGLRPAGPGWEGTILEGIESEEACYFVHSYGARPRDPGQLLATCDYNGVEITAAVHKDNVVGVQFHPEKSGAAGLRMLATFIAQ